LLRNHIYNCLFWNWNGGSHLKYITLWQEGERKWGENHNNHNRKDNNDCLCRCLNQKNFPHYHNTNLHSKIVTFLVSFVAVASCGHVTWNGRWEEVSTTMWLPGAMSGLVTGTTLAARIQLKKYKNRQSIKINEKPSRLIKNLQWEHTTDDIWGNARKESKTWFSKWFLV
jgi:hypothetical protein